MIRAVMVMNTLGKPRLTKFYDVQRAEKQQELLRSVYAVLCSRPENVSSFMEVESIFGPDSRLVYKHFATLYVVFVFASSENELAMLNLIQVLKDIKGHLSSFLFDHLIKWSMDEMLKKSDEVFVETLDKCFKNVCELDVVFNYNNVVHTILDEIIVGGQVLETNSTEVVKAIEEISKLETASNAITLVPKSVSGWRSR